MPAHGALFRLFWKIAARGPVFQSAARKPPNPMCRQTKMRSATSGVPDAFILPSSFFLFPALPFQIRCPSQAGQSTFHPIHFLPGQRDASRRERKASATPSHVLRYPFMGRFQPLLRRPMDGHGAPALHSPGARKDSGTAHLRIAQDARSRTVPPHIIRRVLFPFARKFPVAS